MKDGDIYLIVSCLVLRKISRVIPKRYIDQLEYMGYDVSKLEYKLKEDEIN